MRITICIQGGIANFPGLQRPASCSLDELPHAQADELRQLLDALDFFQLPAKGDPPPRGAADYRTYIITVETEQRHHTVTLTDPVKDERLQRLIKLARSACKAH